MVVKDQLERSLQNDSLKMIHYKWLILAHSDLILFDLITFPVKNDQIPSILFSSICKQLIACSLHEVHYVTVLQGSSIR